MPEDPKPAAHLSCSLCSTFYESEYGFQKNGWPENNTYLPGGYGKFTLVKDLKPGNNDRALQLLQCPECKTYYLYRTDYEYLAGGSEDEQFLDRLTDEQAVEYQ